MFIYQQHLSVNMDIERPNAKDYAILHDQIKESEILKQAFEYIEDGFFIYDMKYAKEYMELAVTKMNDMEVLSHIKLQLQGVDAVYYDTSNDDTPAFSIISLGKSKEAGKRTSYQKYHDLTASLLHHLDLEKKRKQTYQKLIHQISQEHVKTLMIYLKQSCSNAIQTLQHILEIQNTAETKDFGLGEMPNAFDLDTSNYFDKPNPYFLNPNDYKEES